MRVLGDLDGAVGGDDLGHPGPGDIDRHLEDAGDAWFLALALVALGARLVGAQIVAQQPLDPGQRLLVS